MKLLFLKIRNFKGIREFQFTPAGYSVAIYGDNAIGKTTIFDAFCWLLFDKDSRGDKEFSIKPLDPRTGEERHHLETEVEGEFEIDGKTVILARKYYEKWTKKRGSANAEFSGHTTDHFIDGVPVTAGEYKARLAQFLDEPTFKLLTSPTYFSERLHWQERREILLTVCGDISEEDVIASDPELAPLPQILAGRKMKDHRLMVNARRKQINDELERIPIRIDEILRGLPAEAEAPPAEELARLRAERGAKEAELVRIEHGGEIAELEKALALTESELLRIGTAERGKVLDQAAALRRQIGELEEQIRALQPDADPVLIDTSDIEQRITELRAAWYDADARVWTGPETCPTCGQALPVEQIEAARARFNQKRAEDLERIQAAGRQAKADLEQIKAKNAEIKSRADRAAGQISELNHRISNLQSQITALHSQEPYSDEYRTKEAEVERIKTSIKSLRDGDWKAADDLRIEIADLTAVIARMEASQAEAEQRERGLARVRELETQQKNLAAEFEKLEHELYLCDELTRRHVALLTDRINSKFRFARFKLFNELINGGVEPCCEVTFGGVPYSSGLNSAHQIIVGLDIIRTLSEHYGFSAPIWIDRRESITQLPEMSAQIISLVVSEKDKTLRVEVENDGSTTVQPQQDRIPDAPAGERRERRTRRTSTPGGVFGNESAPGARAGSRKEGSHGV